MLKKILISLCISASVAQACETPLPIKEGELSPCTGYVFSNQLEQKIRTDLLYKDALIANLSKQNAFQQEIINLDAKQLALYKEQLNQDKQLTTLEKVLYFGMGALVAGTVAYGTVQVLK